MTVARARIGAVTAEAETICESCGEVVLDGQAYHATCCSLAEITIGHNAVRDAVHVLAQAADARVPLRRPVGRASFGRMGLRRAAEWTEWLGRQL